jgi:single-stranded-DNA-specific exonuclease
MLPSNELDLELLDLLDSFEPYGEANTRPSFLINDADIIEIKIFGKDKSHSKIIVRQFSHEKETIELILFKKVFQMPKNRKITCSYRATKNEFNNRVSIGLIVNKIYSCKQL